MTWLLGLGVLVVLVLGVVMLSRRTHATPLKSPPMLAAPEARENLADLRRNDVVTHLDRDYQVEGSLAFREGGAVWYAFRLVDGNEVAWITARPQHPDEVVLLQPCHTLHLTGRPPEAVHHEGLMFRMVGWGRAEVTAQGDTGGSHSASCSYFHFEGPAGRVLHAYDWGQTELAISLGRVARRGEFDVLPGDEVS